MNCFECRHLRSSRNTNRTGQWQISARESVQLVGINSGAIARVEDAAGCNGALLISGKANLVKGVRTKQEPHVSGWKIGDARHRCNGHTRRKDGGGGKPSSVQLISTIWLQVDMKTCGMLPFGLQKDAARFLDGVTISRQPDIEEGDPELWGGVNRPRYSKSFRSAASALTDDVFVPSTPGPGAKRHRERSLEFLGGGFRHAAALSSRAAPASREPPAPSLRSRR
jgi:hypothetical protein